MNSLCGIAAGVKSLCGIAACVKSLCGIAAAATASATAGILSNKLSIPSNKLVIMQILSNKLSYHANP